ncbi:MAG: hypothetical protein AB1758_28935 [Candidatus Eremiobacterota bacterium]
MGRVLLLLILLTASVAAQPQVYTSPLGFSVNLPPGWRVAEDPSGILILAEPGGQARLTVWVVPPTLAGRPDLQNRLIQAMRRAHPELRVVNSRASSFRLSFRENGAEITGIYAFRNAGGRTLMTGIEARAQALANLTPTLKSTLESLKEVPMPPLPTLRGPLVLRQSPDGSAFIRVPADWTVAGGNWAMVAENPEQTMAVMHRLDQVLLQGPPSPDAYLGQFLTGIGMRKIEVLRQGPDAESNRELAAHGLPGTVQQYFLRFEGPAGPSYGYFTVAVVRTTPAHICVDVSGAMARADMFARNFPVLITMTRSMAPNQEVVMARWNANLARLRQASQTMSETTDIVISAIDAQLQADPYAAYNEYLNGEQSARSDYDGQVYKLPWDVDPATAVDPRDGQSGFTPVRADPNADRRFLDPSGLTNY